MVAWSLVLAGWAGVTVVAAVSMCPAVGEDWRWLGVVVFGFFAVRWRLDRRWFL